MKRLVHRANYEIPVLIAKNLPFIPCLRAFQINGAYPLIEDPLITGRAVIIGSFVLRPASAPAFLDCSWEGLSGNISALFREYNWVFNVKGLDGGWLLANGSVIDAYRLALQYGTSDAVIISSRTVSIEGIDKYDRITDRIVHHGYVWQPYTVCQWPHLKSCDPNLAEKIALQRKSWQQLGYLSERRYPAQIIFTESGKCHPGAQDFLSAKIFKDSHRCSNEDDTPEPLEVYILTSDRGATEIRKRAHAYGLQDRIEDMLIIVPPASSYMRSNIGTEQHVHADDPDIDISLVPSLLFERFGMRIVIHDGGHTVLRKFCRARSLAQLNITFGRKLHLSEIIANADFITCEDQRRQYLEQLQENPQHFFQRNVSIQGTSDFQICKGIHPALTPVSILSDTQSDVAVVTFDCRKCTDFFEDEYIPSPNLSYLHES